MTTPARPASSPSRPTLAIGLVCAAMLAFAVMDGMTKVLSQTLPIPQILWVRSVVFTALAVAMLAAQRRGRRASLASLVRTGRPMLQLTRALLLVIESGIFMLAFKLMPIAEVHAVNAAAPLLVVTLSVPMLGERVGPRRWLAVAVGFLGVLLIVRPGFERVEPPILLALLGAAMWSLYQIQVRQCARTDSSETTALWTALVGLAATTLIGPLFWIAPDATQWALLAAIALAGAAAHIALIRALSLSEPSLLQPYNYTLFVWATVVGYLMFGDVPRPFTLAGAALIVASGLYAWHRERVRAGLR